MCKDKKNVVVFLPPEGGWVETVGMFSLVSGRENARGVGHVLMPLSGNNNARLL